MTLMMIFAASSDLFSLHESSGKLAVNGSMYGMSDRTFTMDVRASFKSFYAVDLIDGCQCANRSDVHVNIHVDPQEKQVVVFDSSDFSVCELISAISLVGIHSWADCAAWLADTRQMGRLVRRPGGSPRHMLKEGVERRRGPGGP